MSERGVAQFISVVGLHFPRPKFNDDEVMEAAWMASLTRTLSFYSDEVLNRAAMRIVDTRDPKKDGRFFPLPAECTRVCREIASEEAREAPRLALSGPRANEWSDERLELAFDLCKSPIGIRAAREGWVMGLYDFCRREMRVPTESEARTLIHGARGFEDVLERLRNGEANQFTAALVELGETIKAKRNDMAERILAGVK